METRRKKTERTRAQGMGLGAWGLDITGKFPSSNQQTRGNGELETRRKKTERPRAQGISPDFFSPSPIFLVSFSLSPLVSSMAQCMGLGVRGPSSILILMQYPKIKRRS